MYDTLISFIERERLGTLQAMLQEAEKTRRLNTSLAVSEEDDGQRARYQHIATEEAKRIKGITKEIADLEGVLVKKNRDDETLEALVRMGDRAVEKLRAADFDDKRRTLLALEAKLFIRRKSEEHNLAFECRLSERFDPNELSVPNHL